MTRSNFSRFFEVPILFLIFNRPEPTSRVFQAIRQVRPRLLFVAADGPRPTVKADKYKCKSARKILDEIDWDCDVRLLLRDHNLGCKEAVRSAINWFFDQVDEGVILEDDTLPTQGFFYFCQELLDYYRDNPQIMHVGGDNFQLGRWHGAGSYYFSLFTHVWGWATWKRAWTMYDGSMEAFEKFKTSGSIKKIFSDVKTRQYWLDILEKTATGKIDTWDYAWMQSIWYNRGLNIIPNKNLVRNIGFGPDATHGSSVDNWALNPVGELGKLIHPSDIRLCYEADDFFQAYVITNRIYDATLLSIDAASMIKNNELEKAKIFTRCCLALHPDNIDLQWLEILAISLSGEIIGNLGMLESFLINHPQHHQARILLQSCLKQLKRLSGVTE